MIRGETDPEAATKRLHRTMSKSAHAGMEINCHAERTDEEGEPILNDHGNPELCDAVLNWNDHGRYVQHPRGEDRNGTRLEDRFEQSALRFDCPDCGAVHWRCPVCSDEGGAPGWFRGESTGDMLACHNCNAKEAARQQRSPW